LIYFGGNFRRQVFGALAKKKLKRIKGTGTFCLNTKIGQKIGKHGTHQKRTKSNRTDFFTPGLFFSAGIFITERFVQYLRSKYHSIIFLNFQQTVIKLSIFTGV
jgi:hypothetical protein